MASSAVPASSISTSGEYPEREAAQVNEELIETTAMSRRGARGAILGVTLGAGLWTVILIAFRVIKL